MVRLTASSGKAALGLATGLLPLAGLSTARAAPLYASLGFGTAGGIASGSAAINGTGQFTGDLFTADNGTEVFPGTPGGTGEVAGNPQTLDLGASGAASGSYDTFSALATSSVGNVFRGVAMAPDVPISSVPDPAVLALLSLGAAGALVLRRRAAR